MAEVKTREKKDWVTPIVLVVGAVGVGTGLILYLKQQKGAPSGLKITDYQNLRTGVTVKAPGVLNVEKDDGVRVNFQYSYKGPPLTGSYHVSFAVKELGMINEIGTSIELSFSIPESLMTRIVKGSADLTVKGIDMPVGTKNGIYMKIMSIPGADIHFFLPDVIYIQEEAEIDFELGEPTAYPYRAPPGPVLITAPITSRSDLVQTIDVTCIVYEGSGIWPTPGTELWRETQRVTISPNQTLAMQFMHQSIYGTTDRRDVRIEVKLQGAKVAERLENDVFYVTEPSVPSATIGNIWAYPYRAPPGPVLLSALITMSGIDYAANLEITCIVYEGSVLPGHGRELWRQTQTIFFQPGQTLEVQFMHQSIYGTIDRRDVGIMVRFQGEILAEKEDDDVFFVVSS